PRWRPRTSTRVARGGVSTTASCRHWIRSGTASRKTLGFVPMTATNGTGSSGTGDHPLTPTLHLLALCAFAIAQPLFDITGDNPTFFVAHRLSGARIVLLALVLVVIPPVVLGLAVYGVRLVSPRAAAVFQSLLIGVLAVLVVYPFVHRSLNLRLRYQAALIVLGVATIAYCYWRYVGFRRFITWTSPAPLVFALVFLFFSPVQGLLADTRQSVPDVEVGSSTPVVLIVFDEFPLSTILDES